MANKTKILISIEIYDLGDDISNCYDIIRELDINQSYKLKDGKEFIYRTINHNRSNRFDVSTFRLGLHEPIPRISCPRVESRKVLG